MGKIYEAANVEVQFACKAFIYSREVHEEEHVSKSEDHLKYP